MKVEFWTNESNGLELLIKGSEFFKAQNDEKEFESLQDALTGYCHHFCFDYKFSRENFAVVLSLVRKGDIIVFNAWWDKDYNPFLDIYLSRNGIRLKIISDSDAD